MILAVACALVGATACQGRAGLSHGRDPAPAATGVTDAGAGPLGNAAVDRVVDGDTVVLRIGGHVERVRLIGVNSPESVSPSVPKQCFGTEASHALAALLPADTVVRIERDVEPRDRFGRLLLYLYKTDDGLFVNQWLVASGYATTLAIEPNTAQRALLEATRDQAEAAHTGLWGSCDGPAQPLD